MGDVVGVDVSHRLDDIAVDVFGLFLGHAGGSRRVLIRGGGVFGSSRVEAVDVAEKVSVFGILHNDVNSLLGGEEVYELDLNVRMCARVLRKRCSTRSKFFFNCKTSLYNFIIF